jgi:hypothetical protein
VTSSVAMAATLTSVHRHPWWAAGGPGEAHRGHNGRREVPPPSGIGEQQRVPVSVGEARHVADLGRAWEERPANPLRLRPQRGGGPELGERR